ncbi:MAG: PKD domain-containing protein [Flavihumibacter sp.]
MKAIIIGLSLVSSLAFQPDPVKRADKNLPPVANAGDDITLTSRDFVQLDGTASVEPDGLISRYNWSQVSGKQVRIANPNAAITAIEGASAGEYIFRLVVTDEKGSTGHDEIKLTIK